MQTFFSAIAAQGSLLIRGEHFYFLTPQKKESKVVFSGNIECGLIPAGTLQELLVLDEEINKREYEAYKKKFIEEQGVVQYDDAGMRNDALNRRNLFSFIIQELMPLMSGHKEEITHLLATEITKEKLDDKTVDEKELAKAVQEKKALLLAREAMYERGFDGVKDQQEHIRSLLLRESDVMTLDGKIYRLFPDDTGEISIQDKGTTTYRWKYHSTVSAVEELLLNFVTWKLRLQAVEEYSAYLEEIERTRLLAHNDINKIMQLQEFSDGDVGFLQRDRHVYLYLKIPPFAMFDPRPKNKDICYEFPTCHAGINIWYNQGIKISEPVLFEAMSHPFLRNSQEKFQTLCGGRVLERNGSHVEWVAKALDDAKNLVMNGLTPKSIINHGGNREDGGGYYGVSLDTILEKRKISVAQAKEKGLLLTNKWEWKQDE
ncbi:MAG: hypothetical protein Q7R96_04335 [Nanoarchaeota archaeon]|nr:hypothetical protein [Nanoarchaeota archaeon]